MALECSVKIAGDYALVQAEKASSHRLLRFDLSKSYSRCYENTREQAKSYLDDIVSWFGERPLNVDSVLRSLMLHLAVKRRQMGLSA